MKICPVCGKLIISLDFIAKNITVCSLSCEQQVLQSKNLKSIGALFDLHNGRRQYLLRKIPRQLWIMVSETAKRDKITIRELIINALINYCCSDEK